MNTARWVIFLMATIGLFCAGCGGVQRPDGFPKLYPLAVVVQNNGQPIDEVRFQLISGDASVPWGVGGRTNSSGEGAALTFQGTYSKNGCPEGTFTVILRRTLLTGLELSEEEYLKLSVTEQDAYSARIEEARRKQPKIIPDAFASAATNPVIIEVTKDTRSVVFELSQYQ